MQTLFLMFLVASVNSKILIGHAKTNVLSNSPLKSKTVDTFWRSLQSHTEDFAKYCLVILSVDNSFEKQSFNDSGRWFSATTSHDLSGFLHHPIPRHLPLAFLTLPKMGQFDVLRKLRKLNRVIFILWNLEIRKLNQTDLEAMENSTESKPWDDLAPRMKQIRTFPATNYLIMSAMGNDVDLKDLMKQTFAGETGVFILEADGRFVVSMGFEWVTLSAALKSRLPNARMSMIQADAGLLSGVTLRSSSATYCPFVCRDTAEDMIEGMEVDMFKLFGRAYNFTAVVTEPADGAWGALVGDRLTGDK
jgi:hypothetical protein